MCDVCFVHYFQIIYIDLQPISKNSLTLLSAEYGFYFNHLVHVSWYPLIRVYSTMVFDDWCAENDQIW